MAVEINKICVRADGRKGYAPIKEHYRGLRQVPSDKGRNFKNWLRGVHSYCNREYLQRYIDEYFFRLNRRNHRESILEKIIERCVKHPPATYGQLKMIAN